MAKVKVLSAEEAVKLVKDGDTLTMAGFVGSSIPEALAKALEKRFLETGSPKDLTYTCVAGQGNKDGTAGDHFAHEGMVTKIIVAHYNFLSGLTKLITENKAQGWNIPQGVCAQMIRDSAAKRVGSLTKVGLGTFADPRNGGGKLNDITKDDIVQVLTINGEETLFYPRIGLDVAFIRGTYADENGNVVFTKEVAPLSSTSQAMAVHNNGGTVIVQVERVVKAGTLDPKLVKIPGIYVDVLVECQNEDHSQSLYCEFDPALCGEIHVPTDSRTPAPLNERKVIGRRAAMELTPDIAVNLGVGVPEYVASVADEEGIGDAMTLTVEGGPIGGIPGGGLRFGASLNAQAYVDEATQFDFYDGGGLDMCFLGLAEADEHGNVNLSRFNGRIAGSGGSISISSKSKKAIFCGTFTAGAKYEIGDGKIKITQEGKAKKFVKNVEEITFNGKLAVDEGHPIMYVTERAVFVLKEDGMHLTEVAPGIDIEKDILPMMDFTPIMDDVKLMDERIFKDEKMGLTI